jgi:ABC-type multidrug transport system fused ATPase/permease subunit
MNDIRDIELEEELAQTKLTRNILMRLLLFLKPYKGRILMVLLLELVWVGLVALGPVIIQRALDSYIPSGNMLMLAAACTVYALTLLGRWFFELIQIRINMRSGQGFLNDLRRAIFKHVQHLSMSYFDKTKHGRIIARADRDVDNLEYPFVWGPIIIISCIFSLILSSAVMAAYNWKLFLSVLAIIPIMGVASEIFRRRGMAAYRKIRESLARITAYFAENISGIRVVHAFCRESFNLGKFTDINTDHKENTIRASIVWNLYFPIISTLFAISVVVVIVYGGKLILDGEFTIGKLSAYVFYLGMFFGPIMELSDLYNGMLSGASGAERIFLLLDTKPQIENRDNAIDLSKCEGHVLFSNVYFNYGNDGPWILKDISFSIEPGQSIALVGFTGSGKTSIANLVSRFYEAQKGSVKIDGHRTDEITLESLHSHIGIVLQDNYLFSGTVMDNLRFGRPDASGEEIIDTAKVFGTHGIIMGLADGYMTRIQEGGGGLSLGERQLICFTRVFVSNPQILVLDEATSAVDTETEELLQKSLRKLLQDRTSLIIAHRLSTIRHADRILVLDNGTIMETGTHDELVWKRGKYFRMYEEYMR